MKKLTKVKWETPKEDKTVSFILERRNEQIFQIFIPFYIVMSIHKSIERIQRRI